MTLVGQIYFIRAKSTGNIKVGWSSNVARRLQQLRTGHAEELELLASFNASMIQERQLHEVMAEVSPRLRGEWFAPSEDADALAAAAACARNYDEFLTAALLTLHIRHAGPPEEASP